MKRRNTGFLWFILEKAQNLSSGRIIASERLCVEGGRKSVCKSQKQHWQI